MRESLVYRFVSLPLDNFFMPYTLGLSVNWPHQEPESCLQRVTANYEIDGVIKTHQALHINPELERHGADLESWSLDRGFAEAIPILADTCRIR